MSDLTVERVREVLNYNPDTGILTWRVRPSTHVHIGDEAGNIDKYGYRRISIDRRRYPAHRLAWLHETGGWPVADIDHINMIRDDNRWINLRLATRSENLRNQGSHVDNTSGYKGVFWHSKTRKWRAGICVNYRQIHLGYYTTPELAHAAYCRAAPSHHGEFARTA